MLLLLLCSCQVVSDSLWPFGLQHARPPSPSPSPRVCPSSYSLHQWRCPAISSSNTLFSFCPQSFPASGTLLTSHLFSSDDQNSGASALASVLPVNIQGWSPLRLTGLISLLSKGLSGVFSNITVRRHQFFGAVPSLRSSSHNRYVTTGKSRALTIQNFVGRVMSLLFNTLSRFVKGFLLRSNRLMTSWLQLPSTVILEPKKRKSVSTFTFSPLFAMQ